MGEVPSAEPAAPTPPEEPPALAGEALRLLPVAGHLDAVISVPLGTRGARPVLVATHGNYDKPEWQCEVWGEIVGVRGFVLCPRGVRRGDSPGRQDPRYEYASNQALEREIDAGLAALKAAFPGRIAEGPVVLAGFSLGAIQGVAIATRRPNDFPRLVLIEGGDGWARVAARSFHEGGGQRVLFACSQGGCLASANAAAAVLRRAGVEVAVEKGKNEGHTYVGEVRNKYAERFPWLVEGDKRWE